MAVSTDTADLPVRVLSAGATSLVADIRSGVPRALHWAWRTGSSRSNSQPTPWCAPATATPSWWSDSPVITGRALEAVGLQGPMLYPEQALLFRLVATDSDTEWR